MRQSGYSVVTKDADFSDLCVLFGFPPTIIWIRRGNCSTTDLEALSRQHQDGIKYLETDKTKGVLTLF